jgi:CheY-like chemotaxis protein
MLRRMIGEDIVLTTVLPPLPSRIRIDPNQIDQVLMNLSVNARDAMPTGGRITIETRELTPPTAEVPAASSAAPGAYVELAIGDSGCGMSDEVKARIFEPFYTTKGLGRGTGLGLSVIHGIVAQAGGHIVVDSTEGRGSTFRVRLPAQAPSATIETAAASSDGARGDETVLLVEDDDAVRRSARAALESHGYQVLVAAGGQDALAAQTSAPGAIDLLVTDVVMPEMSGRELAERLRARQPALRVLYMSGYTEDAVVRHGIRDAADPFLPKPFTASELASKVRAVLLGR